MRKLLNSIQKKNLFKVSVLVIFFLAFFVPRYVSALAGPAIIVSDLPRVISETKDTIWDSLWSAAQVSLLNASRAVINQVAFETATYLGSGAEGQAPLFYTVKFGEWIRQQGSNAGGSFVEEFVNTRKQQINGLKSDQIGMIDRIFAQQYDICAPNLDITAKISLGLVDYTSNSGGLAESRCNLSRVYKDTTERFNEFYGTSPDALTKRQDYFKNLALNTNPSTTDIGAAFNLFGLVGDEITAKKQAAQQDRTESAGWNDIVGKISGKKIAPPETVKNRITTANNLIVDNFGKQSGNIFADAANIFLNQLALSAFNKLLETLGKDTDQDGVATGSSFTAQGNTGGVTELERRASSVLQTRFNERTDYNILAQLSSCNDEEKPGPTNCVITQQFAQAIEKGITVGEALGGAGSRSGGEGLLDGTKRLGYDEQGNEMSYRDGYPYRSLIILRKYRILPVGWEVAAQYIKENPQATKDVTLNDLVACYSDADEEVYPGLKDPWCRGLIDPTWTLKLPKMFCGMEGYGTELLSAIKTVSNTGYCTTDALASCSGSEQGKGCTTDFVPCSSNDDCSTQAVNKECNFSVGRQVEVSRNNSYCADEQSCIKENANGSCAYYGYCTQEKRRWVFNEAQDNACEARNNTCQSFRSETGAEVAYLENTLNFDNCGANQVGCKQYATTGTYTVTPTAKVTWDSSNNQRYFNQRMTDCDPSSEGCHEFIRTVDNIDTNLIADGSFESSLCVEASGGTESRLPSDNNSLVKSANAQLSSGCVMSTVSSSGYLPSPNSRWYINVPSGSVKAGITKDIADHGRNSMYIEGNGGLYSSMGAGAQLLPIGFTLEPERFYTLSAVVRPTAGKVRVGFGLGASNGQFAESTVVDSWQNLVVNFYAPLTNIPDNIYIQGTDASAKFYIDSVKLTVGESISSYNEYYTTNLIYEKLLPPYLELTCYQTPGSDFKLKTNAPPVCFDFARKCNADEVGCKKYVSALSGIEITAKTKPKDFCPGSCVGYNMFVQQPNNFNAMQSAYFIPSTARSCSAQAVGCTAFTNLDKLAEGGEAIEYFSYMRSCMKPDALSCDQFYTWEGSDESGYQLRTFSLKKNGSQPQSTLTPAEEELLCNAEIFKKLPSEPGFNHDCREFYARDGTVSYHLYSRTISCADDCHPYRREVASSAICTAGGGTWDATQSRCLHYAIPSEGTTCSAPQVGCQEYTGNVAGNVRTIFVNGFESTTSPTDGWLGGNQSNNALNLGGHSLQTFQDVPLLKNVGADVERNLSYTVSFLAKAQTNATSVNSIDFVNKDDQAAVFDTSGSSISNSEWKLYTFNLSNLDHEVTPAGSGGGDAGPGAPEIGEKLRIRFNAPVFVDNIRLTEVPNRYYLIKDSWVTPDECDQDMNGAYAPRFMLGCSQYRDVDNRTVNLHSFSQLCQDSAAGCEQMIDTNNSLDNRKRLYNDTNNNGTCDTGETSCVQVAADTMINVVYDKDKFCQSGLKGCSRLGQMNKYDTSVSFNDVFKSNNPDNYNTTICSKDAVGCSQYTDKNGGTLYFKDPGNEVCEWRIKDQTNGQYGWFKKKINRCGGTANGALCSANSDCSAGQTCTLHNFDDPCDSSSMKTIGVGGSTGRVTQPAPGANQATQWAGTCASAQAGCTEYIEPLSKINENLLLNASFENLDTDPGIENWTVSALPANSAKQDVSLFAQTIYILKGDIRDNASPAVSVKITCSGGVLANGEGLRILDANNEFKLCDQADPENETPCESVNTSDYTTGLDKSIMFYVQRNNPNVNSNVNEPVTCTITRTNSNVTPPYLSNKASVFLRQAIVDYQLSQNLDRSSHNGLVNNEKGAVLFNERTQAGNKKATLLFNADATYNTLPSTGASPQNGTPRNANVILQVKPDRVCSQWLSCTTYLPDPSNPNRKTCLNVSLCDALDSNGGCSNFVTPPNKNINSLDSIANLTGYSKVGFASNVGNQVYRTMHDYYNFANMTQVGQNITIVNGNFESNGSGWGPPAGISFLSQPSQISQENLNQFQAVKGQESADFIVPEGKGILKVNNASSATQTDKISLNSGARYVMNMYTYSKGGGLKVKLVNEANHALDVTLLSVSDLDPQNQWVKQSLGFKAASNSYKIVIEKTSGGDAYIDDIRIESGLNTRCTDANGINQPNDPNSCVEPRGHCSVLTNPETNCQKNSDCPGGQECIMYPQVGHCSNLATQACFKNSDCPSSPSDRTCIQPGARPQFAASSCRLYANENALSCVYTDKDNVINKGIRGYCLENDPKDPATCLLWYPVSRIAGDTSEEGSNVNFNEHGTYYCIDAVDACGGVDNKIPGFYCNKFVKVDTNYYWNRRISQGSSFKFPNETPAYTNGPPIFPAEPLFYPVYPTNQMKIDFGGGGGPTVEIPGLLWGYGDGYFGSYGPLDAGPNGGWMSERQVMELNGGSISSFIPYYGDSAKVKCSTPAQPYNWTCGRKGGWENYGDNTYFIGAWNEDSQSTVINDWDVCVPRTAITLDFDTSCENQACYPENIQDGDDIFAYETCDFGTQESNNYVCQTDGGPNQVHCKENAHNQTCTTTLSGNRQWTLTASGTGDTDDAGCIAYCYNRTKEFSIAKKEPSSQQTGVQRALDAIRRIYPVINRCSITNALCSTTSDCSPSGGVCQNAWQIYEWGTSYTAQALPAANYNNLSACPNGVRPYKSATYGNNTDYCYINPKVNNIKVNGLTSDIIVNGSADVTLSFDTQTDPEQLPLKNINIEWGYSDASGPKQHQLSGNMADVNPRQITHRYDYYTLNNQNNTCYNNFNQICQGAEQCCEAIPNISITDNWGRGVSDVGFPAKIIVKKPQ